MKKRLYLVILSFLMVFYSAIPVSAKNVYEHDEVKLKEKIDSYVNENRESLAGMQTAIFTKEKSLHRGYYGHSNIEDGIPMDNETVIEWGSVTKLLV
ncbi:MAG: beta-lactamase family protein [Tissierellia bacterium]|nr:beta-lactamase family protein [Tissierellia bacterium]